MVSTPIIFFCIIKAYKLTLTLTLLIILTQPLCSLYTYSTFSKTVSFVLFWKKKIISYNSLTPNWDCITTLLYHKCITIYIFFSSALRAKPEINSILQDLHNPNTRKQLDLGTSLSKCDWFIFFPNQILCNNERQNA